MCSPQDIASSANYGTRIQNACVRIAGHVPRRMLQCRDRIDRLCRRLVNAGLGYDSDVLEVIEPQNRYREWCAAPGADLAPDPAVLEATATRWENECTNQELRLTLLEDRATAAGH